MADSFEDALRAFMRDNEGLLVSKYDSESRIASLRSGAETQFLPNIVSSFSTSSSNSGYIRSDNSTVGRPSTHSNSFSLSVRQPIFSPYAIASVGGYSKQIAAELELRKASMRDMLLSAIGAYLNVIKSRSLNNLQVANLLFVEKEVAAAKRQLELGEINKTKYLQAKAQLASAKATLADYSGRARIAEAQYNTIFDTWPTENLPEPKFLPEPTLDIDQACSIAFKNDPALKAAIFNKDSALVFHQAAKLSFLPNIGAEVSYTRSFDSSSVGMPYSGSVALSINVPIFTSGSRIYNMDITRINLQKNYHAAAYAMKQLYGKLVEFIENFKGTKDAVSAAEAAVSSDQVALAGVIMEYNLNNKDVLDVISARTDLLSSQTQLVSSKIDHQLAACKLLLYTKGIWFDPED